MPPPAETSYFVRSAVTGATCEMQLGLFMLSIGMEPVGRYSDSLRAEDRILVGTRFSASVRIGPTGLLYNGYRVFPRVKAASAWR